MLIGSIISGSHYWNGCTSHLQRLCLFVAKEKVLEPEYGPVWLLLFAMSKPRAISTKFFHSYQFTISKSSQATVVSMWSVERKIKPKRFSSASVVIFLEKKRGGAWTCEIVTVAMSKHRTRTACPAMRPDTVIPPCRWPLANTNTTADQAKFWQLTRLWATCLSQDHKTKLLVESSTIRRLPNTTQYRQESCVKYAIEQDTSTISQDRKTVKFDTWTDTWTMNQNRIAALSMHSNKTLEESIETGKLCKYANYQTLDQSIKTGNLC